MLIKCTYLVVCKNVARFKLLFCSHERKKNVIICNASLLACVKNVKMCLHTLFMSVQSQDLSKIIFRKAGTSFFNNV